MSRIKLSNFYLKTNITILFKRNEVGGGVMGQKT